MHKPGAAAIQAKITADFRVLHTQGASFVRWFVFPATGTDGITWSHADQGGANTELPSGLTDAALRDIDAALTAAEDADIYLILTIFSFDGFRQTHAYGGVTNRSLQPLLDAKLATGLHAIQDGIVAPLVHRVRAHRLHERVAAWDIINEPEWAVTGLGCEGMQSDDRSAKRSPVQCTPISTMQRFIATTAATIRENSADAPALITVGAASMRTAHYWATTEIGQDFYQVHRYDHQSGPSPTDMPAAQSQLNDRPILLGELPGQGLDGADALTTLNAVHRQGYAGALLWSFSDRKLGWDPSGLAQFVEAHGCQARMPSR